jgi:hypothetical protein
MNRVIPNVQIEIRVRCGSDWIFGNESSSLRVVPAGAIKHEASLRISFAASVIVTCQRASGAVAKGIVSDLLNDIPLCISQCPGAAKLVREEVMRGAVDRLPDLVVYAWAVKIIRRRHSISIRVAYYICAVVDKPRSARD